MAIDNSRTLELDDIDNFVDNPRFNDNPAFIELVDGLRASGGLHGSLEVTQIPGEQKFITYRGGGTRLFALRQLYSETNDPCFNRVPVILRDYPGQAALVANHLAENDTRGDLSFIERAVSVLKLKQLLEQQQGELSDKAFITAAEDLGYKINRARLPLYRFTVDSLFPYIPQALRSGMGRPQITRLHELFKSLEANLDDIDAVWIPTLVEHDGSLFPLDTVESELQHHFGGAPLEHPAVIPESPAPRTERMPSSRRQSTLKSIPDSIHDCLHFSDEMDQFNVSIPDQPLDPDHPQHANACLAWHVLRTLDPTCQPADDTINDRVGQITTATMSKLDHGRLSELLRCIATIHDRIALRNAEQRS